MLEKGLVSGILRGWERRGRAYVADYAEADGDFVLGVFGEDGAHYLNCVASVRLEWVLVWQAKYAR